MIHYTIPPPYVSRYISDGNTTTTAEIIGGFSVAAVSSMTCVDGAGNIIIAKAPVPYGPGQYVNFPVGGLRIVGSKLRCNSDSAFIIYVRKLK